MTTETQWISNWDTPFTLTGCEQCDWIYLSPPAKAAILCPHCGQTPLTYMDETADQPVYTHPPEQILPFTVTQSAMANQIKAFGSYWFSPKDLQPSHLIGRLQPLYMPMWLADAQVQAQWQAEVGFNYEVVSHRERHANGQWHTQQIKKTKVRWEPRVGTLERQYDNTPTPALEDHQAMVARLGPYDQATAQPFQSAALVDTLVRLPNRPPDDAWSDVTAALKKLAAEECRQAAQADHIRTFRWTADYSGQHWTQLLLPLYTTYYLDDEDQPHVLLIHGQTGRVNGRRRASMKRALRLAQIIAGVAVILFLISLAFMFLANAQWADVAQQGMVLAAFGLLLALLPLIYVWQFNHSSSNPYARQPRR